MNVISIREKKAYLAYEATLYKHDLVNQQDTRTFVIPTVVPNPDPNAYTGIDDTAFYQKHLFALVPGKQSHVYAFNTETETFVNYPLPFHPLEIAVIADLLFASINRYEETRTGSGGVYYIDSIAHSDIAVFDLKTEKIVGTVRDVFDSATLEIKSNVLPELIKIARNALNLPSSQRFCTIV